MRTVLSSERSRSANQLSNQIYREERKVRKAFKDFLRVLCVLRGSKYLLAAKSHRGVKRGRGLRPNAVETLGYSGGLGKEAGEGIEKKIKSFH